MQRPVGGRCILKELKPGGGWGEREGKNILSLTVFGEQLHGKLLFYYHFEILHRKHTTYCLHLGPTMAPALDLGRLTGPEPGGMKGLSLPGSVEGTRGPGLNLKNNGKPLVDSALGE